MQAGAGLERTVDVAQATPDTALLVLVEERHRGAAAAPRGAIVVFQRGTNSFFSSIFVAGNGTSLIALFGEVVEAPTSPTCPSISSSSCKGPTTLWHGVMAYDSP
jgi:hypothetical protein